MHFFTSKVHDYFIILFFPVKKQLAGVFKMRTITPFYSTCMNQRKQHTGKDTGPTSAMSCLRTNMRALFLQGMRQDTILGHVSLHCGHVITVAKVASTTIHRTFSLCSKQHEIAKIAQGLSLNTLLYHIYCSVLYKTNSNFTRCDKHFFTFYYFML